MEGICAWAAVVKGPGKQGPHPSLLLHIHAFVSENGGGTSPHTCSTLCVPDTRSSSDFMCSSDQSPETETGLVGERQVMKHILDGFHKCEEDKNGLAPATTSVSSHSGVKTVSSNVCSPLSVEEEPIFSASRSIVDMSTWSALNSRGHIAAMSETPLSIKMFLVLLLA